MHALTRTAVLRVGSTAPSQATLATPRPKTCSSMGVTSLGSALSRLLVGALLLALVPAPIRAQDELNKVSGQRSESGGL